jgi:bacillithiol biosynthesis deacetylase BshB1
VRTGIVTLTRGELGTRGTVDERRSEAAAAASVLGVSEQVFLDCGDGGLRTGAEEEDALIEVLRRLRPRLVLSPPRSDRHPDHERASSLVASAVFYAGLVKRAPHAGPAFRPLQVLNYYLHRADPTPSVIVDVSATWQQKIDALEKYHSQLTAPGIETGSDDQPTTRISATSFFEAIVARGRHYGQLISVEYGEPFHSPQPLAVRNPLDLVTPEGLA